MLLLVATLSITIAQSSHPSVTCNDANSLPHANRQPCCRTCPSSHPYCSISCYYNYGQTCTGGCAIGLCTCAGEAVCYAYATIPCPTPSPSPTPHLHSPPPSLPQPSPSPPPPLLAVSTVNGITYYSGSGSSWTVPQYSPLVSYACQYNLCTITAPFDGTASNPLGNSIDFAGPNYQPLPYSYTIEMGARYTFSRWRVAGQTWYRFGQVHLKYADTSGTLVTVPGSNTDFTTIPDGEFAYGTFGSPVTASRWQVVITSYANTDYQARFQCYLREVQFGAAATSSPPPPSPWGRPPCPRSRSSGRTGTCT